MHPIQMQEGDRGIGMGYTAFINRFEAICQEHLHEGEPGPLLSSSTT